MELLFDQSQQEAIDLCLDKTQRIVWVSGIAGTGKTSIMKEVHDTWQSRDKTVQATAPTGKAAKRIREACDIDSKTMHAALEYPRPGEINRKTGKPLVSSHPKRDHTNPMEADVHLVDEYSMVNYEVHRNFLDAMKRGSLIRMFGDANQLQPIEKIKTLKEKPSQFLQLMEKFPGQMLTTIHRQGEGSSIITNGQRILNGQIPKRFDDYRLNMTDEPDKWIKKFWTESDKAAQYRTITSQIISPTNVGWCGTLALNAMIQELCHDASEDYCEVERHEWDDKGYLRLYSGDKVIYTTNNYTLGIFNGETGIVKSYAEFGEIEIDFGDKVVVIPPQVMVVGYNDRETIVNPQKDLELAYVITTHKSQGSEYASVMYVMNRSRSFNLNRKNLYTGQSRARKEIDIVCDQQSLWLSVSKKG
jgi:exodeoxyribonuclease V alpha subunit